MIREAIKQLKTEPRDLRRFGLTVGCVLGFLGLWFFLRHKTQYPYFLYAAFLLSFMALAIPRHLKQVYIGWMTVGLILGLTMSTLLLTVFFYLVLTPMGLAARWCGKDFLDRRWNPKAATFWRARDRAKPKQPADYERQF